MQRVGGSAAEVIDAVTFTAFRDRAAGAMNRDRVARDGVRAPGVAFAVMVQIDLERPFGLDHPDGAKRVSPRSDERRCSRFRVSGAGAQHYEKRTRQNDLAQALCFHAAHVVELHLANQARSRRLLSFPAERDVLDPQFAVVANERELQGVSGAAIEAINTFALAAFRREAAFSDKGDGIAVDSVFSPQIASSVLVEIDLECAVIPDGPDRSDGILPGADKRHGSLMRIKCARSERHNE